MCEQAGDHGCARAGRGRRAGRASHAVRFDLVFSAYTLHHVTDLEQTLKQLRGLLTAGGQALLVDIVGDPGLIDTHGHTPRTYFLEETAGGYAVAPVPPAAGAPRSSSSLRFW